MSLYINVILWQVIILLLINLRPRFNVLYFRVVKRMFSGLRSVCVSPTLCISPTISSICFRMFCISFIKYPKITPFSNFSFFILDLENDFFLGMHKDSSQASHRSSHNYLNNEILLSKPQNVSNNFYNSFPGILILMSQSIKSLIRFILC